jgi:hypothetical protein
LVLLGIGKLDDQKRREWLKESGNLSEIKFLCVKGLNKEIHTFFQ